MMQRRNTVGLIAALGLIAVLGGIFTYRFAAEMKRVAEKQARPREPWERETG